MIMHVAATALTLALAGAGVSHAEGYSISDLGNVTSESECLNKADRVIQRYKNALGSGSTSLGSWTAYAWDMEPGDQDTVIVCAPSTEGGTSRVRAILVVHGETSEPDRIATREVLKGYWSAD